MVKGRLQLSQAGEPAWQVLLWQWVGSDANNLSRGWRQRVGWVGGAWGGDLGWVGGWVGGWGRRCYC
jgi:hypothetical protein